MNALVAIGGEAVQTMSSREIAELCDKRHDNVRRTIEALADKGVIVRPQIEDEHDTDAVGRPRVTKVYRIGKRDSYVIVAQLSPEFTARLVDRWQELEAMARPDPVAMLNDPAAMRGLLLGYSEKVLALEAANAELAPKAQALARIAESEGSYAPTDAAKTLGIRPRTLINWLRGEGRWLYRRAGADHDVAYQDKLHKGWLEHKITTVMRSDGSEKTVMQARITTKGLAVLAETLKTKDEQRTYAPNRIRELRKARRMSMGALGAALDPPVAVATIYKLENSAMALSLDYIRNIAKVLGVTPAEIIGEA